MTIIIEQLQAFLRTNPDSETVNSLIELLKDNESERQRQRVKADLEWKDQLPESFPPGNKKLREKFRRMYNQLKNQGITVNYSANFSGKDVEQWLLTQEGKQGRLMWFRKGNEWSLHGFIFVDEKGQPLAEFSHVAYH